MEEKPQEEELKQEAAFEGITPERDDIDRMINEEAARYGIFRTKPALYHR